MPQLHGWCDCTRVLSDVMFADQDGKVTCVCLPERLLSNKQRSDEIIVAGLESKAGTLLSG